MVSRFLPDPEKTTGSRFLPRATHTENSTWGYTKPPDCVKEDTPTEEPGDQEEMPQVEEEVEEEEPKVGWFRSLFVSSKKQ